MRYPEETGKDGFVESWRICGGYWQSVVEEVTVCRSIKVHISIHLILSSSDTWASSIVRLVFLSTCLPLSVICLPRLLLTSPNTHNARIELNRFQAFFSIGHEPTSLVRSQVQTDSDGYILMERGSQA